MSNLEYERYKVGTQKDDNSIDFSGEFLALELAETELTEREKQYPNDYNTIFKYSPHVGWQELEAAQGWEGFLGAIGDALSGKDG